MAWEYAWYEMNPAISQSVAFYQPQDPGFESAARRWLTTAFLTVERYSPGSELKLHPQTPPMFVLSFLGSVGWELVTESWAPTGGARWIFKRPLGSSL